jgi:hypothetical protein
MRVIAETYTKLMAGGGAANIDVTAVFTDLQDLTSQYGNLFQVHLEHRHHPHTKVI